MNAQTLKAIQDFIQKDDVNLPLGGSLVSVHSQNSYYVSDSKARILRFSRNTYEPTAIYKFVLPANLSADQITIEQICANSSGQHIILSGSTTDNCPLLFLMDTADARPIPKKEKKKQNNDGKTSVFQCKIQEVDPGMIKGMVGLSVLQISWHPHSNSHFAVLMSDNDFRLYSTQNLVRAEQSVTLKFGFKRQLGLYSEHKSSDVIRFEFSKGGGYVWSMFTVYFLRADGGIFAMCPIAPFGMTVQESTAKTLLNSTEANSGAREWVKQTLLPTNVFELENENDGSSQIQEISVLAKPFLNHVPMFQGPLNDVKTLQEELEIDTYNAQKVFPQLVENIYESEKGYASCLGVVASNGKIGFLWQSDEILPTWSQSEPTVLKNSVGRVVQIQWVSQAKVSGDENLHLLDVVDPGFIKTKYESDIIDDWPSYSPIRLLSTKVFQEPLYAYVSKNASLIVKLPWLKQLAEMGDELEQKDLHEIQILKIDLDGEVVFENEPLGINPKKNSDAALVGFATSNSNIYSFEIVSLLSDGKLRVTVPDLDDLGHQGEEIFLNDNQFNIFTPPPAIQIDSPPLGTNCSTKVPKNADMATIVSCMGEGVNNLRETYLNFLHQSHYDMKRRMKELRELPDLSPEVLKVEDLHQELLRRNEVLESRIVRAKNIQKNLQERFNLMKEVTLLNMSLQQEMSDTEIQFKHELADMQREHRVLAEKSNQLRKDFMDSWRRDVDGGRGMQQMYPEEVPQVHMSKLKEMLEMQNKVIAEVKGQVRVLERTVNDETARLN
eukprot:TRINITY_DN23143_c0_g1_i15.p1 TRINITY_DN23143_c0_g1~~TRINITY_DN23143_c0_g1_i15.p1  ORF type:complete len:780 (-),score=154.33 TRINITY_DN23143_c0_g1_i15:2292-4631(-)